MRDEFDIEYEYNAKESEMAYYSKDMAVENIHPEYFKKLDAMMFPLIHQFEAECQQKYPIRPTVPPTNAFEQWVYTSIKIRNYAYHSSFMDGCWIKTCNGHPVEVHPIRHDIRPGPIFVPYRRRYGKWIRDISNVIGEG